jgi:hypothetical protein
MHYVGSSPCIRSTVFMNGNIHRERERRMHRDYIFLSFVMKNGTGNNWIKRTVNCHTKELYLSLSKSW